MRLRRSRAGHALQLAEVLDVLPRREAGIQARLIGQHAKREARTLRICDGIDPIDEDLSLVWPHQRVQHPQRCRLARAVWAEETRDLPVGGAEADAIDGAHVAESLVEVLDADHCGALVRRRLAEGRTAVRIRIGPGRREEERRPPHLVDARRIEGGRRSFFDELAHDALTASRAAGGVACAAR